MKVLLFSGFYLPGYRGGGPIKTIKNLVDYTGQSICYKIITSDRDLGDKCPYNSVKLDDWNEIGESHVFYLNPGVKGLKQIFRVITENDYDILYLNSFFSLRFSLIPLIINKLTKKQVVLGPRGEFSKGALRLKLPKKKIYISLFKLFNLQKDIIFQASSRHEQQDIINIIGNNVNIYIAEDIGSQDFTEKLTIKDKSYLKGVFISRISPKKNLLLALKVLESVRESVSYDIYGPIEDTNYWKQCESTISKLPSHIKVTYKGEVQPSDVIKTLSKYDFFFMPTKGENYGHVIAEALCAGLPLVVSDTTPWRHLEKIGIGWDISLENLDAFSTVINQLAKMSVDEHREMRKSVLAWAKNKFSKKDSIDANIAMFEYAANKKVF